MIDGLYLLSFGLVKSIEKSAKISNRKDEAAIPPIKTGREISSKNENCFKFKAEEVNCPKNKSEIKDIVDND